MFKSFSGKDLSAMQESLESSTELTHLKPASPLDYCPPYAHINQAPAHRKARNGYKPFPPLLTLKTRPKATSSQSQWWVNRLLGKFGCSCSIFCKDAWQQSQNTEVLLLSRSPSASPESLRTFNLSPTRALTSLSVEECTLLTEGIRASSTSEYTTSKRAIPKLDFNGDEAATSSLRSNPPQNMSASVRTSGDFRPAASPSPLLTFRRSEEYIMNLPSNSSMDTFFEEFRVKISRSPTPSESAKEPEDTESCFEREVLQMGTKYFSVGESEEKKIFEEANVLDSSPGTIEEWPVSTTPITTPEHEEKWIGLEEDLESILEGSLPELIYSRSSSNLIRLVNEIIDELRAGFRKLDVNRSGLVSRHNVESVCLLYDLDLFTFEKRAAGLWPTNGPSYPSWFQYATFLVLLSQQLRRGPLQDRVVKNWQRIDLMVIGDPGVGKSSFVARALHGRHARPSTRSSDSLEFSVIPFWRNHSPGVVRLWDIPVDPKFPALTHYYEKMNGFLLLSWLPREQDRRGQRGMELLEESKNQIGELYSNEQRADHNFLASCEEWVNLLPGGAPIALFFNKRSEDENKADKSKLTRCCRELPIDNIFVGSANTGEGVWHSFKWLTEASIEHAAREQSLEGEQIEIQSEDEPASNSPVYASFPTNNVVFSKPLGGEFPVDPLNSADFPPAKETMEAVKQVTKSRPTEPVEPVDIAVYPTIRTPQRVRVNLHPGYSFLSVREGPSTKSRLLGKIVAGTILTVLDKSDHWIRHELGWTAQRWNDRVWLIPIA